MTSFRVEVSGWDLEQQFFVEKTDLEWSEGDTKEVRLHAPVQRGAVLFVRLLERGNTTGGFPVAYEADSILPRQGVEQFSVKLKSLHPRSRDLAAEP